MISFRDLSVRRPPLTAFSRHSLSCCRHPNPPRWAGLPSHARTSGQLEFGQGHLSGMLFPTDRSHTCHCRGWSKSHSNRAVQNTSSFVCLSSSTKNFPNFPFSSLSTALAEVQPPLVSFGFLLLELLFQESLGLSLPSVVLRDPLRLGHLPIVGRLQTSLRTLRELNWLDVSILVLAPLLRTGRTPMLFVWLALVRWLLLDLLRSPRPMAQDWKPRYVPLECLFH